MINNKEINAEVKPSFSENIKYTSNILLFVFSAIILIKAGYDISEGAKFFGDKNVSFFDAWSLEHIITGMSLSYFFLLFKGPFSQAMERDDAAELAKLDKNPTYSEEQKAHIAKVLKAKSQKSKIIHHSLVVIGIALAWEIVELYMETAVFNDEGIEYYFLVAQEWFSGVELFLNRFFVDVLLVYLGWFFIRHKPVLATIAAPISLFWLLVHIFVFQDSMFLHENGFQVIVDTFFSLSTLVVLAATLVVFFIMNSFKAHLRKSSENV